MKKLMVIMMSLSLALMAQAALASFSYSVSIHKHNVIVTKLDNGKTFMKVDGQLIGLTNESAHKVHRFEEGSLIIVLDNSDKFLEVEKGQDLSFYIDLRKGLVAGKKIKYGEKEVILDECSMGDAGDNSPLSYFFQYMAGKTSGKDKGHILVISQQSEDKKMPELFTEAIMTFKSRRLR